MNLRKWTLIMVIAIFSALCMYGCGTVGDEIDDDNDEQNVLLPRTQQIDASKVAIIAGNYVVTEEIGACEANATIEIGVDNTGVITLFAIIQADDKGRFTYNEQPLPSDSKYIYLYAKAPGKRRSAPISLENKVIDPLNP